MIDFLTTVSFWQVITIYLIMEVGTCTTLWLCNDYLPSAAKKANVGLFLLVVSSVMNQTFVVSYSFICNAFKWDLFGIYDHTLIGYLSIAFIASSVLPPFFAFLYTGFCDGDAENLEYKPIKNFDGKPAPPSIVVVRDDKSYPKKSENVGATSFCLPVKSSEPYKWNVQVEKQRKYMFEMPSAYRLTPALPACLTDRYCRDHGISVVSHWEDGRTIKNSSPDKISYKIPLKYFGGITNRDFDPSEIRRRDDSLLPLLEKLAFGEHLFVWHIEYERCVGVNRPSFSLHSHLTYGESKAKYLACNCIGLNVALEYFVYLGFPVPAAIVATKEQEMELNRIACDQAMRRIGSRS